MKRKYWHYWRKLMDKVISEIADEEKVARILFSPSHVYKGRVSPKAFKLEKLKSGAEDYISVLRYDADQLDSVSAVFQPRTKGDSRYGYTFLNARDVRNLDYEFSNRKVELLPKPSKRLPLHAGIFLSIDGRLQTADDISPDIDFFQKELAMLCDGVHKF